MQFGNLNRLMHPAFLVFFLYFFTGFLLVFNVVFMLGSLILFLVLTGFINPGNFFREVSLVCC